MKIINEKKISVGLALSGGGSRAIAFHLGCLKALHELNLLKDIDTISSVSGGSVISALYSYNNDSFEKFEKDTKKLLAKGLQWGIFFTGFNTVYGLLIMFNYLFFLPIEALLLFIKLVFTIISKITFLDFKKLNKKISFSLPRKFNRTTLFEKYLEKKYLKGKKITDKTRNNINVVFNACELITGTAFRFGNKESGCWRYGKVKGNNVKLSTAVTASAAFPVLLPAMNRIWEIEKRNGDIKKERLFLTDGGVYENLGVSVLEPNKKELYSYNHYPSDFIICCNAGHGQFRKNCKPSWWATRMTRAFSTVFKNVLHLYTDKLFIYKETKKIYGFVNAYLGQIDGKLEPHIKDLIPREIVIDYPTDFAKMPKEEMGKIILRGYQLTTGLLKYYYPELI
ncbi:MAG: patatin-like phospholipase family protein [Ignavibacteriae bacterium]|nr:patatin-like phospholipase family protein [Ignavibacteriota bacterium]